MRLNAAVDQFAKANCGGKWFQSCFLQPKMFLKHHAIGQVVTYIQKALIMALFCSISLQASTSRNKPSPVTSSQIWSFRCFKDSFARTLYALVGGPMAASSPPMEHRGIVRPQRGLTAIQTESKTSKLSLCRSWHDWYWFILIHCRLTWRWGDGSGKQVTYNSLIAACHRGSQWQRALIVLKELDPCNDIMIYYAFLAVA